VITDTLSGLTSDYNLTVNETYVLIAEGIVSGSGYSPATPFGLAVYSLGREAAGTAGNTDVLVHHGSTDAPIVDVDEVSTGTAGNLVNDAGYGDFSAYLELPTADYQLQVKDQTGTTVVASYDAPLATLGLTDAAVVVVASGFLNPANNSNGPAFGLYVALASGGALVPLPTFNPVARIQAIHNSADAATNTVDVYLTTSSGSTLLLDDFQFRNASPFIDAPAEENITIGFAGGNSTSVGDTIPGLSYSYNLATNNTYILVAEGIVSGSGYSPATPFGFSVYGMGREVANATGNTDVLVHHGSTDAPTVDIVEVGVGAGTIVDDASYGDFAPYLELATLDYQLQVKDQTGTTVVASYDASLASLGLNDAAITVIASGFLDPSNNSNGSAFGLFVALAGGGGLVALPATTPLALSDFEKEDMNLSVYPNPVMNQLKINGVNLNEVNVTIVDVLGKQIDRNTYTTEGNTINVSGIRKGTYQIVISNNSDVVGYSKFVKF